MTGLSRKILPGSPPAALDGLSLSGFLQQLLIWQKMGSHGVVVQTATFNAGNDFFYPIDCTSGAVTITLPAAVAAVDKTYFIKKVDSSANAVTISPTGSDTLDGAATQTLSNQWNSILLRSDGISQWYLLSFAGGSTSVLRCEVLTAASGTWTPATGSPTGIIVNMIGGGGGSGGSQNNQNGAAGGGGSGEAIRGYYMPYTGGISYGVGSAGTAGGPIVNGGNGGTTTFGTLSCAGGLGSAHSGSGASSAGNTGGGRNGGGGGSGGGNGNGSPGTSGTSEGLYSFGGNGGGGGGQNATASGGTGAPCEVFTGGTAGVAASSVAGGGGGGSSPWGQGGAGGNGNAGGNSPAASAKGAGAGGAGADAAGGSSGQNGAAGAPGTIEVYYIA